MHEQQQRSIGWDTNAVCSIHFDNVRYPCSIDPVLHYVHIKYVVIETPVAVSSTRVWCVTDQSSSTADQGQAGKLGNEFSRSQKHISIVTTPTNNGTASTSERHPDRINK